MIKTWRCLILILMGLKGVTAAPLSRDEGCCTQTWFKDYMHAKDLAEQAEDGLNGTDDEIVIGKEI